MFEETMLDLVLLGEGATYQERQKTANKVLYVIKSNS